MKQIRGRIHDHISNIELEIQAVIKAGVIGFLKYQIIKQTRTQIIREALNNSMYSIKQYVYLIK
jgi:hypothetical protein